MQAKRSPAFQRVAYLAADGCLELYNKIPRVPGRAGMVHNLIKAYGLLKHMSEITPYFANEADLKMFHSPEYIEFLKAIGKNWDDEKMEKKMEEFGLEYDCPIVDDLYSLICSIAGGSLAAADCIISNEADVAINWNGGWHHAKRDEASGFCYVNDVVLCLLRLREKFSRVLYVDLDLHHGDGVEDAFCATRKVLTVSFHKQSPGFFPGSGRLEDIGVGKGKFYSVNVPLKDGIDDATYTSIVKRVMSEVFSQYKPQAVVCQCGADGVSGDPLVSFNLTPGALATSVEFLLSYDVPTVLLGGGGYNFANTARCWTLLTATSIGLSLPAEIPEHEFFTEYGPGFDLDVYPSYIRNMNTSEDVARTLSTILDNLKHITAND